MRDCELMRSIIIIGFISLICACTGTQNPKQTDKEQIEREVRLMFKNYHEEVAAKGLSGEFKYLDDSEDFYWVPPGYDSPLSYDSVRQILLQNDRSLAELKLRWDTLRVIPLSSEIVNYTGIVVGHSKDTLGTIYPVSIIESGTLIKRANGWKLLSGQSANIENNE